MNARSASSQLGSKEGAIGQGGIKGGEFGTSNNWALVSPSCKIGNGKRAFLTKDSWEEGKALRKGLDLVVGKIGKVGVLGTSPLEVYSRP